MTFKNLVIGLAVVVAIPLLTGCEIWFEGEITYPANQSPVAKVVASPNSGYAKLNVAFDGSSSYDPDGQIVSYHWNFGDGTTGSGATITHRFEDDSDRNNDGYNEGYTVTLTVTDDDGAEGADSLFITCNADMNKLYISEVSDAPETSSEFLEIYNNYDYYRRSTYSVVFKKVISSVSGTNFRLTLRILSAVSSGILKE